MRSYANKSWCPEEDSNLHALRHTDLNRARLPIPPSGQRGSYRWAGLGCQRKTAGSSKHPALLAFGDCAKHFNCFFRNQRAALAIVTEVAVC